jgi:PKHD-type hydroxylase
MFYTLDNILNADDLKGIHEMLPTIEFKDGKATAGWAAKAVKNNLQAQVANHQDLQQMVKLRLMQHPIFGLAAMPARLSNLVLSKYGPGMSYGLHLDDALMERGRIRTDLAFTIFLSDPESYEGGELMLDDDSGARSCKPAVGSAILYPGSHLHSVAPVSSGARLAIVGWVQSLVRDNLQRQILYDLSLVRQSLHAKAAASADFARVNRATGNLMRMWVEN